MNEDKAVPTPDNRTLWLALFLILIVALYLAAKSNANQFAVNAGEQASSFLTASD